jgi:hypothetical protein
VLKLAHRVEDEELETKLRGALARDVRVLALELDERDTILLALEDPPEGLEELRGVLFAEWEWRRREGLTADK